MKILFIGGTGIISSACTRLCVDSGYEVSLLNRGITHRPIPPNVELIKADIHQLQETREKLRNRKFDVVVDWICFTPEQAQRDLELFSDITKQFIFISSASAYETPPRKLPVTEQTPLYNPIWEYSRNKIACEDLLLEAWQKSNFPVTIVRPSHTYDQTLSPIHGGYTMLKRLQEDLPIVVHGDGTSVWVMTHHEDFAKGFIGLFGKAETLGTAFHITSDELLTWNQIYQMMANALGGTFKPVYIPSTTIAKADKEWGDSLLGDKTHSMIFDNTKIKTLVPEFECRIPFQVGAKQIADWYLSDSSLQVVDPKLDELIDYLIKNA